MNSESMISSKIESGFVGRWVALALVVGLTVMGGALYGSYSQRWGPPADLVAAAKSLQGMPVRIGTWSMVEELPMESSALEMLECAGYVNRRYMNQETGQVVSVAVIAGPPGPIAVHTPEICYSSRAYELQNERKQLELSPAESAKHSFWSVDFTPRNVLADKLRVYYAWSLGDIWEAAEAPRYQFAAAPALFKIQLAASVSPVAEEVDPGSEFLSELLKSNWQIAANL